VRNKPNDLSRVKAAEQAELVELRRRDRRDRWKRRLSRWEETLRRWERTAKRWAIVGSILSGAATGVAKLHAYIEARRIPDAQLPAPTGTPTTAPDFVPEPQPAAERSKDGSNT
jgi:hypothetical protein